MRALAESYITFKNGSIECKCVFETLIIIIKVNNNERNIQRKHRKEREILKTSSNQ